MLWLYKIIWFLTGVHYSFELCWSSARGKQERERVVYGWLQTTLGLLWEWLRLLSFLCSCVLLLRFWLVASFLLPGTWLIRGTCVFQFWGPVSQIHLYTSCMLSFFFFLIMVVKYSLLDRQNQVFKNSNKKMKKQANPIWLIDTAIACLLCFGQV